MKPPPTASWPAGQSTVTVTFWLAVDEVVCAVTTETGTGFGFFFFFLASAAGASDNAAIAATATIRIPLAPVMNRP